MNISDSTFIYNSSIYVHDPEHIIQIKHKRQQDQKKDQHREQPFVKLHCAHFVEALHQNVFDGSRRGPWPSSESLCIKTPFSSEMCHFVEALHRDQHRDRKEDQKEIYNNGFIIQFSSTLPQNIDTKHKNLFGNISIDNDELKSFHLSIEKRTINKSLIESLKPTHENSFSVLSPKTINHAKSEGTISVNIPVLHFKNLCIFKSCTFKTLRYIIAYVLNINITDVDIRIDFTANSPELTTLNDEHVNNLFESNLNRTFHHHLEQRTQDITVFKECISIGNVPLSILLINNNDNKINNYEEIFYPDYFATALYIKKNLLNMQKQKITSYPLHLNISHIIITLAYSGPLDSHSNINIDKLFNLHRVGKPFSKIYLHSDNMDSYLSNPRPMQYVKTDISFTNVFKGLSSLFNTCSLYWGTEIDTGLTLQRIDVETNMTINLSFININSNNSYDKLIALIKEWLNVNLLKILKSTKINECIYNLNFDYAFYIPFISSVSASINVPNTAQSDIDALNEILSQEICKLKFKTRTSIQMNAYGFWNFSSVYRLLYLNSMHEFLTTNILYKDLLPNVHVGMNTDTDSSITISNAFNYENLIYLFYFVLSAYSKISKNLSISDSGVIETPSFQNMTIESIRTKCSKYGKNLLKILEKTDPRLFGPRVIGKSPRSYSGLCQKHKQRAVPITKEEYEFLHDKVPNSVVNIRNQTYQDQRIYLFCPYKKYSFLNYHVFPNQLCIIRCTTKSSNKTQYNYCANALDAEHVVDIQNKYENQTITLYNPLITKGRKCRLPDELKDTLVNFILLKVNVLSSIYRYCLSVYDKHPFIIRRDPNERRYLVLSEYNETLDYVLIIQSEMNDDYFIVLNEDTMKPLIFSENDEIKKFFISCVKKTESQYNFFNFIEKILKVNINQFYNEAVKFLLNKIRLEFDVKYVINEKFIYGIIWKKMLVMTPRFYWEFEDNATYTIPLFKAIEMVNSKSLDFPSVATLSYEYISDLYIDYVTKKVHMVKYYNSILIVKPFDITARFSNNFSIMFDYAALLMNLYNINETLKHDIKNAKQIKVMNIADIVINYIYIYLMNDEKLDMEKIKQKLVSLGIVWDGPTYIVYTDNTNKSYVSWRSSKINVEEFEYYFKKYAFISVNDNIKNIYNKFQEELKFKIYGTEAITPKIITA